MKFSIQGILQRPIFSKRVYLDFAAATPVRKSILKAMEPYWDTRWANASAIYQEGVEVRTSIEKARESLARTLRVRASDVTFTGGGTEANNLAILGTVEKWAAQGHSFSEAEIITTRTEHSSVLKTVQHLEKKGSVARYVPVDEAGIVDLTAFKRLLSKKTILVSIAYVNSETGVIQDMKKITRTVKKWNEENEDNILVHTDACQAPLWLPCALDALGVDLLTLDAGKCYGPKGIGLLARRHSVILSSVSYGGSQESGMRAGTENTALIIGASLAIQEAQASYEERSTRIKKIRDYGFSLLKKELPEAIVNGSSESRVANNINISIPGFDTEFAVIVLDSRGVSASTRSACGALDKAGSYVVREMTHNEHRATSTLRFTLGEESQKSDITKALQVLKAHKGRMEELTPTHAK